MKDKNKREADYIREVVGEFADFVADLIESGAHEEYDDHFEFLKDQMAIFIDKKTGDDSPTGKSKG